MKKIVFFGVAVTLMFAFACGKPMEGTAGSALPTVNPTVTPTAYRTYDGMPPSVFSFKALKNT